MSSSQAYQSFQKCQICDRKVHFAMNYFQNGCQICNRVGHTTATCFDRNNSNSQSFIPSQGYLP